MVELQEREADVKIALTDNCRPSVYKLSSFVTVSANWRLVFEFGGDNATNVDLADDH
jgi:plasmid maintenance system killer protein